MPSEYDLSAIPHCLKWYKLVLRTRLSTAPVRYLILRNGYIRNMFIIVADWHVIYRLLMVGGCVCVFYIGSLDIAGSLREDVSIRPIHTPAISARFYTVRQPCWDICQFFSRCELHG